MDYENNVCKYENSRCRINSLKNCLSTDIIPDFLKFCVPKTDVFSNQAVHLFQLKLLRSEISTAADTHCKCDQKRAASRKVLLKNLDNHLLPSVIFVLRNRVLNHVVNSERRLQGKLAKFSERQDKPLRASNEKTVAVLDNIILPGFIRDLLVFGPKHPIRDKFKKLHFLVDIDSFIRNLREKNVSKLFKMVLKKHKRNTFR